MGPVQACDGTVWRAAEATGRGARESERSVSWPAWCFPHSPRSCPTVLDAKGLARRFFNQLWEVCSQWQKQVPLAARAPQRQWLVSIHAIRNTRRKMEDRHVCLPTFNQLFGLSVSAPHPRGMKPVSPVRTASEGLHKWWGLPWVPSRAFSQSQNRGDAYSCCLKAEVLDSSQSTSFPEV